MTAPLAVAHDALEGLNRSGMAMLAEPPCAAMRAPEPGWIDGALPLFRAMLTLGYDAVEDILPLTDDRAQGDALAILTEARDKLLGLAEDMRETWICDRRRSCTTEMSGAEWEAADAFNDALEEATPTLTDAMRRAKAEVLS